MSAARRTSADRRALVEAIVGGLTEGQLANYARWITEYVLQDADSMAESETVASFWAGTVFSDVWIAANAAHESPYVGAQESERASTRAAVAARRDAAQSVREPEPGPDRGTLAAGLPHGVTGVSTAGSGA